MIVIFRVDCFNRFLSLQAYDLHNCQNRDCYFMFNVRYLTAKMMEDTAKSIIRENNLCKYNSNEIEANHVASIKNIKFDDMGLGPHYTFLENHDNQETISYDVALKYSFALWYYQTSHGEALIRSINEGFNIDIYLHSVGFIDMPVGFNIKWKQERSLGDNKNSQLLKAVGVDCCGQLVEATNEDYAVIEEKYQKLKEDEKLLVFLFDNKRGYVVGNVSKIVRNSYDVNEMSIHIF